MNIEDRLTDALHVYQEQTPGSVEVWERIEARTAKRSTWAQLVAVVAITIVLIVVGVATLQLRRSTTAHQVTAATPTQDEFVTAANRSCADFKRKLDVAVVVFHTPTGYAVVAAQLADIGRAALSQTDAFPVPDAMRGTQAADHSDLLAAVAAAERAGAAARNGDVQTADTELQQVTAAFNRVGTRLANDGAEACRPA